MNFNSIYKISAFISAFSVIIPLISIILKKGKYDSVQKLLFIYLALTFITECINGIYLLLDKSNLFIGVYFTLVELVLILWIFRKNLILNKKTEKFWPLLTFIGILLFGIGRMYGTMVFYSGYSHNLILALCFYSFYQILDSNDLNFEANSIFWMTSGFFLYFGSSFFLHLFIDFILGFTKNTAQLIWLLFLFINFLYYIFLSISIWKTKTN